MGAGAGIRAEVHWGLDSIINRGDALVGAVLGSVNGAAVGAAVSSHDTVYRAKEH